MPIWPKYDSQVINDAFSRQREVDPFGHNLHAWLGALWCFLACGPVSVVEFGIIPVLVCFLIRLPRHFATHRFLRWNPIAWAIVGWIAWQGCSILWSLDQKQGFMEWGANRFALSVLVLFPVLDRRKLLIAGLALGIVAANLAQVAHAIGTVAGIASITFDRLPHRNSGWWQPVVGGTMLTAAVGLHLPAALRGVGRERVYGLLGAVASITAVAATGSRGAWIATACLLIAGVVWAVARGSKRFISWGHAPFWIAIAVVVGAAGYKTLWPTMSTRANEGIEEVRRAVRERDFSTYTGARIIMAQWAWRATLGHPAQGIGAGSFKSWVGQRLAAEGLDPAKNPAHAHCHNTFLQAASTTGLVGLVMLAAVWGWSFRQGCKRVGEGSGYEWGTVFALIGLLLVTPFDVVNVNAQTSAMWWIVVALCLFPRPSLAPRAENTAAKLA